MGAFLRARTAAMIVVGLLAPMASSTDAATREAQVKAAYLYKLASFVRWPDDAFRRADAPFRICLAGRDDISAAVEVLARGQKARERAIAVARVDPARAESAADCQILFLGRSEAAARSLLPALARRPILIVTDSSGGTRGGIIHFVLQDGRVRFAIDLGAAKARQLELSSKLLAVAESIEP
jgi:hypothetical protein